jgi:hypothetical protein
LESVAHDSGTAVFDVGIPCRDIRFHSTLFQRFICADYRPHIVEAEAKACRQRGFKLKGTDGFRNPEECGRRPVPGKAYRVTYRTRPDDRPYKINPLAKSPYAERLADMVQLWRKEWGLGELPFYFAEIAPYAYGGTQQEKAAYLREAQFRAQSLIPNSAMISTNDLVEPYEIYNIHPRNKTKVGQRLSYLALNLTYGLKQIHCFGPQYKSWTAKGSEAWVSFDHLEMGICRNYDLRGFEVAGEDRVFHPADKVWLHWQTNEVVISSEKVPNPVAVRYCFRDFQVGTMIGGNELPTIPFRTDNW